MADLSPEQKMLRGIIQRNLDFWTSTTANTSESAIATLIKDNERMQQAIKKALATPGFWEQTVDTLLDMFVYIERLRLQRDWTGWIQATFDAATEKHSSHYCLLLNRLGQMKRYLEGRDDIVAAITMHQQALDLAVALGDQTLEGLSYFQLAEDYRRKNEPAQAKVFAMKAVELCEQSRTSIPYLASSYGALGLAHMDLAKFELATRYMQQAYQLFKENDYVFEEGGMLLNLGLVRIRQNRPDKGLANYLEAEQIFLAIGAKFDLYLLKINLASFYYHRGELDAAEKAFEEIDTKYLLENGHLWHLAMKTHGLGDVAHAKGDPHKALPYLTEAIGRWQEQDQPFQLAYTLATRKGVYLDLNEPEKALADHKSAARLISQNPDHYDARAAQKVLDKWDRRGGVPPSGNTPPKT